MTLRIVAIILVASLASGCTVAPEPAPTLRQTADRTATLQAVFGPPSHAGFGSAFFAERVNRPQDLEVAAKQCFRYFLGKQWGEAGEKRWLAVWRRVYARPRGQRANIVAELRGIQDNGAHSVISALIEGHETPDNAEHALSAAYDDVAMENLEVYTLGDGAALSGLLIAGRANSSTATLLVFLMD